MADQYKIPQNIDVEDKILGPFTLRQFLYMIGGVVIDYVLYITLSPLSTTIFIVSALPVTLLTLGLVFIKINERDFFDFLIYFIQYSREPKEKRWKKDTRIKEIQSMATFSEDEKGTQNKIARMARHGMAESQLSNLAKILDTTGWSGETPANVLQGRIVSSEQARSAVIEKIEKQDEGELEDVFGDLSGAIEKLQVVAQEEEFKELGKSIKVLLKK